MDDRFSVAFCPELMGRCHFVLQLKVIVDFAVKTDPDGSVFIRKRLLA